MPPTSFDVRPARREELGEVAKLAAVMVRLHSAWDPLRFSLLREPIEPGYEAWLSGEMENRKAVILAAVARAGGEGPAKPGQVLGYAYARLEGRDWGRLREPCAILEDLVVGETAREHGVASALVEEVARWAEGKGMPRLVLETAAKNDLAQAFFKKRGFRPTMVEMTRELGEADGRRKS